ncbi:MAG: Uma2 family endonuclease [Byssovorax sp.]
MSPRTGPASAPIIGPTEDEWRALSPAERERFLVRVLDSLSDPVAAMSEGRPHKKAKTRTLDRLGLHFNAVGRAVYLAEEMAVVYPGEPAFSPDVLAVLDVVEPEDDQRMAWVVADEKKGIDLVLEVLHHGDRNKDLVENVERYAGLGIAEYFVYDRGRQRIHGFRLPPSGPKRYQHIIPQAGRYTSNVLGLDLAVTGGNLRFFLGEAELPGTADLLGRLHGMVEELNAKADETEGELARATARADQATTRADQVTVQRDEAITVLRTVLIGLLEARGVACPDEARARVAACDDPAILQRWILRAGTAASASEAIDAP